MNLQRSQNLSEALKILFLKYQLPGTNLQAPLELEQFSIFLLITRQGSRDADAHTETKVDSFGSAFVKTDQNQRCQYKLGDRRHCN